MALTAESTAQNDFEREMLAGMRQQTGYENELHRLAGMGHAYGCFCANFLRVLIPPPTLPDGVTEVVPCVSEEHAYELLKLVLTVMAK